RPAATARSEARARAHPTPFRRRLPGNLRGTMGEEQRPRPEEQLAAAREAFEEGTDFTVAVEEEFAILDPHTLTLANRFEELQEAARGTALEPHLVGELIASEVEVRTGKCDDFAVAAPTVALRRG